MRSRITWMDTLRGAAMLLLLFWHAAAIPGFFGWVMPEWLYLLNEVFLPWRMPTLMFLSGLLLAHSLRKRLGAYYVGKARAILWPYLIWAAVHIITSPDFEGSILAPRSWVATGYLWFIFYLLLFYCVAPLVTKLPWWLTLPAFAAGAFFFDFSLFQQPCYFAVFFFAAYYLRAHMDWFASMPRRWLAIGLVTSAAFTAVSLWMTARTGTHYFKYEVFVIPFAMTLILVSIRAAAWLDERHGSARATRGLRWVGLNSIVFYLTHFPVMTLVSWAVDSAGVPLALWIVPVNWLAAVAVAAGLAVLAKRQPVSWLFSAPSLGRRRSSVNA